MLKIERINKNNIQIFIHCFKKSCLFADLENYTKIFFCFLFFTVNAGEFLFNTSEFLILKY